jgi:dTDP-4-dehydrorhamnose 3,5-epimerase-like enzyme
MDFFGGRARLVECSPFADERGRLLPFQFSDLPFVPGRAFAVADVPVGVARGGHAHRSGMQLLVCLQGRIETLMRVADAEERLMLSPSAAGLLVGPGVWCQQTYLVEGSVLLVFASEPYDPSSYVDRPPDQR